MTEASPNQDGRNTLGLAGNRTQVVETAAGVNRTVKYTYDDNYRLKKEDITEPNGSYRTIAYTYDKVGNRLSKTDSTASREVSTIYTYNEKDQLQTEEITTTTQRLAQASMPPAPTGFARHGLSVSALACLGTLLTPLGLLLPRGSGIGKRARRRRIFTTTLSLLLALLMVVSPQQLYALQVQSQITQEATTSAESITYSCHTRASTT